MVGRIVLVLSVRWFVLVCCGLCCFLLCVLLGLLRLRFVHPLQQVAGFCGFCLWVVCLWCGVVNSVVYFTYVYVVCHFALVCLFKVGCVSFNV